MDKLERYEIGIDKTYEEMYRLIEKVEKEEMSETQEIRLKGIIDGFSWALAYMTSERVPRLKSKEENNNDSVKDNVKKDA